MEWKKAKNILIFLFLIIDIFLLGINFFSSSKNNVDYGKLSVALLKKNIKISEKNIPKNKKSGFVYEFYSVDVNEETKKILLGEYEKNGKNEFVSKNKKASFSVSGNKIFYYNSSPNFDEFKNVNEKNIEKKLKSYVKILGAEKYAKFESVTSSDGEYVANYKFFIDDNNLFSSKLEFCVSEKGIHKIDAVLNIPDKKRGYKFELSSIETILMNFSQNSSFLKTTEITDVTYGYYISEYENAVVSQALPVYMIETKENSYIYDARNGVDSAQRCLVVFDK